MNIENFKLIKLSSNCQILQFGSEISLFVSYTTTIGILKDSNFYYNEKFYSLTTSKHLRLFKNYVLSKNNSIGINRLTEKAFDRLKLEMEFY